MKLSDKTLRILTQAIIGEINILPQKSNSDLFYLLNVRESDIKEMGKYYSVNEILHFPDKGQLKKILENLLDPREYLGRAEKIEDVVEFMDNLIAFDGYRVVKKDRKYIVAKEKKIHKTKTKSHSNKGGRPPDPKIKERNKKINSDYYGLTTKKGYTRGKALKILAEKFSPLKISTIEKILK